MRTATLDTTTGRPRVRSALARLRQRARASARWAIEITGGVGVVIDAASGQRIFRSTLEWLRSHTLSNIRWATELAGVGLIAGACWLVAPAAGLLVVGIYAVILANTGGE